MLRRSLALLTLAILTTTLRAADPSSQPATENDDTTPLGMLRSQTQAVADSGNTAARARIHVADARFNDLADTLAQLSTLNAKLEVAVAAKWGEPAAAEVAHALGTMASSDVDTATVTTDADHATVHWKSLKAPSYLIRVDGHWKRDLDKTCATMDASTFALSEDFYKALVPQVDQLNQDFAAGKFIDTDDMVTNTRLAVTKIAIAIAKKNQPDK